MPSRDMPGVSVIVPAFNAADCLDDCLQALCASSYPDYEVIVVDDHSRDETRLIASAFPVRLLRMERRSGPAAARNRGVSQAGGSVLVFVDADVIVRPETIGELVKSLRGEVEAVVGVYDEKAEFPNFSSKFKNLWLCSMFQAAPRRIDWFWTGCGAIRREAFQRAGGFDEDLICCEDYALGYALHRRGGKIRLDKSVRVKHCHLRSWFQLLNNDFSRSRDNIRVLMGLGRSGDASFATKSNALGVVAAYAALLCLPLASWTGWALAGWLLFSLVFLACNRVLLGFLLKHSSIGFMAVAVPTLYAVFLIMGLGALAGAASWATAALLSQAPKSALGSKGFQG